LQAISHIIKILFDKQVDLLLAGKRTEERIFVNGEREEQWYFPANAPVTWKYHNHTATT
jgi:c-di-GMP-binding flagellar brake protein YcgR